MISRLVSVRMAAVFVSIPIREQASAYAVWQFRARSILDRLVQ